MMLDWTKKPDVNELIRYERHLDEMWLGAHARMREADTFYLGQHDIWEKLKKENPDKAMARPDFHSGRAAAIIDHAVEAVVGFLPRWHRTPLGSNERKKTAMEEKAAADRLEGGLHAVVQDAALRQMHLPTKLNAKGLLKHNYTQLRVGLDFEQLRKPERNEGESREDYEWRLWQWESAYPVWNPIVIETPPPGAVLMDIGSKLPRVVAHRKKLYAHELEALVRQKLEGRAEGNGYRIEGDPYQPVEIIEWWSPAWTLVQKGSELLVVERNPWGLVPYAHAFGGVAEWPMGSELKAEALVSQAMLFKVKDSIVLEEQRVVGMANLLIRASFARMGYRGDTAEGAEQMRGDILQGEEADWWTEKVPQLPQAIFQYGQELRDAIEEATYSLQAAGFRQSGVHTATQQIMLSEKTDRAFQHIVSQMESLWSIGGSLVLRLCQRLTDQYGYEGIAIGEEELLSQDIGGKYHIAASFEEVDAVVAMQEKAEARQELAAGLIDTETYYRIARYENPSAIRQGILEDELMKMDAIHQEMLLATMRRRGFGDLADRLEAQARQGAVVGLDGRPLLGGRNGGGPPIVPSPQTPMSRGMMGQGAEA